MIAIGTVVGSEVTENKDADEKSRILQVELTNSDDVQSIEQLGATGEDSNPHVGARVIVLDLGPSYRVAVALSDEVEPSVDEGEKEIYSYDASANKLAYVKLCSDSSVELNGDTDYAVAFNDLKTAFDQLKSDYDDLVTKYNAHVHPGVTTGTGSTAVVIPASLGSVTTANIDPAKIDSIKVP